MKNYIIWGVIIILIVGGVYYFIQRSSDGVEVDNTGTDVTIDETPEQEPATTTDDSEDTDEDPGPVETIGTSAGGNDITAYHFGDGEEELLFVGGIHGGYEWNTVLLARELVGYFEENPDAVPANVRVTVVPLLNPDGLEEVVGTTGNFTTADVPSTQGATVPGRFNGNGVDLNRNFDCDWQAEGTWQDRTVDAGSEAFSEPESRAIRDYIEAHEPTAVVVYYSAAGGVFASNCHNGVLPETTTLTNTYADASGYPAYESFDFYEITGDMVNWLAKEGIPGISILLSNHTDVEWNMNRAGVNAILEYYAE